MISRRLGPKIIMVFKMFADLGLFIVIMLFVLLGYGIAVQVVQYPRANTDFMSTMTSIFYRPYFQIYGELFLEDIVASPSDGTCTNNHTDVELGMPMCPENTIIGVLLLGLYMVISNVLLLNLLIAMFGNTFQNVEEETDVIWKNQFYFITMEYFTGPILTLHFLLPWIIIDGLSCLMHFKKKSGLTFLRKLQREVKPREAAQLNKLEEAVAYNYVIKKRRSGCERVCRCFHHTEISKQRIMDKLSETENQTKQKERRDESQETGVLSSLTHILWPEADAYGTGFSL
ncbi:transient receptor potential cation channel subfamily M member 5-like [Amphiura filiformis]|uniref:transient receptor potential cation channel subfamily M member 5-like n=1 Tax=Amphiura filiformis TaxID=82378 RepID=UPI003B217935